MRIRIPADLHLHRLAAETPCPPDSSAPVSPRPLRPPRFPSEPPSRCSARCVLLIVALTFLLMQTTWIDSASAAEPPAADGSSLAQR